MHRVEAFREYVDVEVLKLRLQHEVVVSDANGAQGVERVVLDVRVLVQHEEEHGLKHLVDRVSTRLKRNTN